MKGRTSFRKRQTQVQDFIYHTSFRKQQTQVQDFIYHTSFRKRQTQVQDSIWNAPRSPSLHTWNTDTTLSHQIISLVKKEFYVFFRYRPPKKAEELKAGFRRGDRRAEKLETPLPRGSRKAPPPPTPLQAIVKYKLILTGTNWTDALKVTVTEMWYGPTEYTKKPMLSEQCFF